MRRFRTILGGLLAASSLFGCGAKQPVYDGQAANHSINHIGDAPKGVYANQLPLYPGVKFTDAMGSESWGDEPDSYSKGMRWEFEYQVPMEKVVGFYDAALPDAKRETDPASGAVTWTLVPNGAQRGESVYVTVEDGKLRIHEEVKPRRSRS